MHAGGGLPHADESHPSGSAHHIFRLCLHPASGSAAVPSTETNRGGPCGEGVALAKVGFCAQACPPPGARFRGQHKDGKQSEDANGLPNIFMVSGLGAVAKLRCGFSLSEARMSNRF